MTSSLRMSSPPRLEAVSGFRAEVRREDADAVEHLVRATGVFSEAEIGIARELVEEYLAEGETESGYTFLFADGAEGLEGYTCFGPIPGTVARYELYWIAVHPDRHRRGLARRLQAASEDVARARFVQRMIAETSTKPNYAPARRFYEAQGYKLLAEIPDWHEDGDGKAVYGKRL